MWWVWWPLCCAQRMQYGLCSIPPVRGNQRTYSLHRGRGLLDGSSCGRTWEDQAGRALLPPVPTHLPTGGSGLLGLLVLGAGAVVPGSLPCQVQGFCFCFHSQRAWGCPWNHFASLWLLYKLFKANDIKSLIDYNRFLAIYCFPKSMTNRWKMCKLLDPQDFPTSARMLLQINSAFVPVQSRSFCTTDCDTWSKSPLIPWNKSLLS